jgi:hypothetical protein
MMISIGQYINMNGGSVTALRQMYKHRDEAIRTDYRALIRSVKKDTVLKMLSKKYALSVGHLPKIVFAKVIPSNKVVNLGSPTNPKSC